MMGRHDPQKDLFSYQIDLDKRVRRDHPLRRITEQVDFGFVREEVQRFYGRNGHESIDPEIILKMILLLFYDDVVSERELIKIIAERVDYMWFMGYRLDDEIPDNSVLSKANNDWCEQDIEELLSRAVV